MSQANIPNITPIISVTRDESATMLLSSIALEEMALAHIMNAEAEKLQFVLGTLDTRTTGPAALRHDQLLAVNASVRKTLQDVVLKEILLYMKFEHVLELLHEGNHTPGKGGLV
ncbi:hypothetical protein IDH44_20755 [Paenibacillus sp. IB182496]|uniref:Uncharacterized protein n=1 Tax=Paenibacillus sabuli TaxID=2772509 RepID=A0A927BYG7_9BACL|nr:hypothetical protein [Paenibacillus sabuli]MBD2847628.1 hypothetical protein [Paenibacillus sabuli]